MPYSNVPEDKWPDMESCVEKVMATGKDKQAAIAICHASIVKGEPCKECGDVAARKRPKSKARAIRHRDRTHASKAALLRSLADVIDDDEAAALAIDPAVVEYDADEIPAPLPAPVVAELVTEVQAAKSEGEGEYEDEPEATEAEAVPPAPPPVTIEAVQALRQETERAQAEAQLAADFVQVTAAIMQSPNVEDKGAAVVEQAGVFKRLWQRVRAGAKALMQAIAPAPVPDPLAELCAKAAGTGSAFTVTKDRKGAYRWLGVFSNNFKDRDGEIIPEAAHREFMAYLDANPSEAPEWFTWHEDLGRKSRADLWDVVDGFTVISGPATPEQAAPYAKLRKPRGMSHGFRGVKQGQLITQYRSYEVSDLPVQAAANPYTEFSVLSQQEGSEMAFTPEKRKDFVELFGEETAAQIEAEAARKRKELVDQGVQHKEAETASETQAEPAPATVTEPAPVTEAAAQTSAPASVPAPAMPDPVPAVDLEALMAKALAAAMQPLQATIDAQAAKIAELEKGLDARVAEAIAPRIAPVAAGVRASTAPETATGTTDAAKAALKTATNDYEWIKALGPLTGGG